MTIFDSRDEIKKLDSKNMLKSIEALPQQIADAWMQANKVEFPDTYKKISNVVVSGMGGSALGSYVIKNLYKKSLTVPFEIVSHYELPEYVNENSLVLLSSYSGTTEETLSAAQDAKSRGAKVMVIAAGGPLTDFASANNYPIYQIDPKFNPCGQPRLAIGYAIVGQLALFNKLGLIQVSDEQIVTLVSGLTKLMLKLSPEETDKNLAKDLAFKSYDKMLVLSGAEHLIGAVHVFNNQLNENAKTLTSEWPLSEFNHHYMEALSFPKLSRDTTLFLLFNSGLYQDRMVKRFPLTETVISNAGYEVELIQATAPTALEQVFEIIALGEYASFYLPMLYGIDPSAIPNVETFKTALG
ncbi:MAG: SIS domain-containing protein [bacterium]